MNIVLPIFLPSPVVVIPGLLQIVKISAVNMAYKCLKDPNVNFPDTFIQCELKPVNSL